MTLFGRVLAVLSARSTFDIDLLTTDPRVLSASLWNPLGAADVHVEIRCGDADDPLAGVVRIAGMPRPMHDRWDEARR